VKILSFVAVLITILLTSACQVNDELNTNIIPTISATQAVQEEAADDIIESPNGPAYRANFQQEGVENSWLSIETTELILGNINEEDACELNDCLILTYRDNIESRVGEASNNILYIKATDQDINNLNLYAYDVPIGIEVKEKMRWQGGSLSEFVPVLFIEVSQNIIPGDYTFQIGIEVNNQGYGTNPIPCTIIMIE